MILTIEELELDAIEMTLQELKLEIAVLLYAKGKLSMGKASRIADMNRILFQKELGKRKVPMNYDEAELERDLETLGLL
jgi:predicted HTH domain antitoxin